jgi:hypothetical protein
MRYCHNCHRITSGEPLFCHHCGSSFDAKLCPSRHVNPRWAVVCSQCGSRDLSTPAPRLPLWLAPLAFVLSLLPGLVLVLLTVMVAIGFINAFLTSQQIQLQFMVLILILGILWFAYIHLPHFIRDLFRSLWRRKKKDTRPH